MCVCMDASVVVLVRVCVCVRDTEREDELDRKNLIFEPRGLV